MSSENKYQSILQSLETMENGDIVNSMKRHQLTYVNNRGVSIPELKEMIKNLAPDSVLAEMLWAKGSRETKLLSIMLMEPDKISSESIISRIEEFDSPEFAEQINMFSLPQEADAQNICIQLFKSQNPYSLQTAFILASKLYKLGKTTDVVFDKKIIEMIQFFANTDNVHVRRAIARALSSYGCKNLNANNIAKQVAVSLQNENDIYLRWIGEEALIEIEFYRDSAK